MTKTLAPSMKAVSKSYCYHAYGLGIDSALPLPELPAGEGTSDIQIRLGKGGAYPEEVDEHGFGFGVNGNQACYHLKEVGSFWVSEGRQILVEPLPGVSDKVLRLSILGPVLALALYQRGRFILHASAIAIDGEAVAFLGGHGWGKSTMAAMLHARGYQVISDDVTALMLNGSEVRLVPSFPQLKLWPDAARSLGISPDALPQLHPELEKRAWRFTDGFARALLPLRRLYLLAIGPLTMVESLRSLQAFEVIMHHWYGARFGPALFRSLNLREHFLQSSRLAATVPVRRLCRPATLLSDPELPGAIERAILRDLKCPQN